MKILAKSNKLPTAINWNWLEGAQGSHNARNHNDHQMPMNQNLIPILLSNKERDCLIGMSTEKLSAEELALAEKCRDEVKRWANHCYAMTGIDDEEIALCDYWAQQLADEPQTIRVLIKNSSFRQVCAQAQKLTTSYQRRSL